MSPKSHAIASTVRRLRSSGVSVVYLDNQIVILNKAAGVVSQPTLSSEREKQVSELAPMLDSLPSREKLIALFIHQRRTVSIMLSKVWLLLGSQCPIYILTATSNTELKKHLGTSIDWHPSHRLDRTTTGCLALSPHGSLSAVNLSRQFKDRRVEKMYYALVRTDANPAAFHSTSEQGEPPDASMHDLHRGWAQKDDGRPYFMPLGLAGSRDARASWRLVQHSVRSCILRMSAARS